MEKDTILLSHGSVEVLMNGNIIYMNVHGEYRDEDIPTVISYLDDFFNKINKPTIRIWNSTNITDGGFKLSPAGNATLLKWSRKTIRKWPDNIVYLIASKPVIFGLSRMYEMKSSLAGSAIIVLHNIDELPENIKSKIFSD